MLSSPLFVSFLLWSSAWAASTCPKDPGDNQWTSVDCEKVQLPYGKNSIVPSEFLSSPPPAPLQGVPTQSDSNNRQSYYQKMKSSLADKKSECDNCVSVMKDLHDAAHKLSPGDISWILIQLCKDKSFFNNGDDCEKEYDGAGLYMAKALYYLDEDTHDMSAVCKFNYKIKDCAAPPVVQIKESEWFKSAKSDQQKVEPKPDSSGKTFGVVHMSDVHLEARKEISKPEQRWGSHGSDSPGDLILSAFSTMKNLVKMDDITFTIFTGDIVAHDAGSHISEEYVEFEEKEVFEAFKAEMTNSKGGIPVYATLGNHDSYPEMFSNSDSSWNYDYLSSLWQNNHWIDAKAAQDVKTQFGAYAVSNPPGLQGLKIISINTDFWYIDNIFNYVNYTNPDTNNMFKFLISELEESEAAKQRVWIIGHVPSGYSGGEALPNPTALFQSIVVRFSPSTIAAVFWGHTHLDQKMIYYDFAPESLSNGVRDTSKTDLKSPLTMGWIGPSIVPGDVYNPAWAYYEVDSSTYSIMEAETYYADISNPGKDWTVTPFKQLYDVRKSYDPSGKHPKNQPLDASFWDENLAQKIENDEDLASMYTKFEQRAEDPGKYACKDAACRQLKKCAIQAGSGEVGLVCKNKDPKDSA